MKVIKGHMTQQERAIITDMFECRQYHRKVYNKTYTITEDQTKGFNIQIDVEPLEYPWMGEQLSSWVTLIKRIFN